MGNITAGTKRISRLNTNLNKVSNGNIVHSRDRWSAEVRFSIIATGKSDDMKYQYINFNAQV